MLIFERDALVRDTCAKLADNLDCDLYSTAYIDNFENIVRRFRPTSIVIDVGLLESDDMDLLRLIADDVPDAKVLFLSGDDAILAREAEGLARSVGLSVDGVLQRPVTEAALEQSLQRIAL
ncbi:MAG: hypothetical protein QNJ07_13795 [Woeseiaceae bacterium]|nr:hypothetical protein [Woeseiaceae bacterium]